jgi:hypothetical protein
MDPALELALGASGLASLAILPGLWRGSDKLAAKLAWSAAVLVPLLGPIAFAVWHDPPPPSDKIDRPPDAPLDSL